MRISVQNPDLGQLLAVFPGINLSLMNGPVYTFPDSIPIYYLLYSDSVPYLLYLYSVSIPFRDFKYILCYDSDMNNGGRKQMRQMERPSLHSEEMHA